MFYKFSDINLTNVNTLNTRYPNSGRQYLNTSRINIKHGHMLTFILFFDKTCSLLCIFSYSPSRRKRFFFL